MTLPLFLAEGDLPGTGHRMTLAGDEGRHAATVQRLAVGEELLVADGAGRAVRGEVVATAKSSLELEVLETLAEEAPTPRFELVQALAKAGRAEQSLETSVELGVDVVVPWQADRSISRWAGPKAEKGRAKWQRVVRAATKQARRFREAPVEELVTSPGLVERVRAGAERGELTLVLHEVATDPLLQVVERTGAAEASLVRLVIGPEGGISPEEIDALVAAGGHPVVLGPHVLRTSTAGPAALAVLGALTRW